MVPTSARAYRPAVLKLVVEGKIKSNLQITEAVSYLKKLPANAVVGSGRCIERSLTRPRWRPPAVPASR